MSKNTPPTPDELEAAASELVVEPVEPEAAEPAEPTDEAVTWKRLHSWLRRDWKYRGPSDADEPTEQTWFAIQRFTTTLCNDTSVIDGHPAEETVRALQGYLKAHFDYQGELTGRLNAGTMEALGRLGVQVG